VVDSLSVVVVVGAAILAACLCAAVLYPVRARALWQSARWWIVAAWGLLSIAAGIAWMVVTRRREQPAPPQPPPTPSSEPARRVVRKETQRRTDAVREAEASGDRADVRRRLADAIERRQEAQGE